MRERDRSEVEGNRKSENTGNMELEGCPRTLSLGDGLENDTSGEFCIRYLSEYIGVSATHILHDALPDFEKLQLQLIHLHLIFRAIGKNSCGVLFLENKFREILYQLEDAFDDYVLGSHFFNPGSVLVGGFYKLLEFNARRNLTRQIKVLLPRLQRIAKPLEIFAIEKVVNHNDQDLSYQCSNQDLFVGRVEDLIKLKSALLSYTGTYISCFPILGAGGVGKTWLAKKLFSELGSQFEHVAWINVSNLIESKTFFLEALLQLTTETRQNLITKSEYELLKQFVEFQYPRKCLIVLDGLCSLDYWKDLQGVLLMNGLGSKSKLLVTTRVREVAEAVADHTSNDCEEYGGVVHVLKGLSEDESWEIISSKAIRPGAESGASKEPIGKEIAKKCNHIPLAINLLGQHLARKHTLTEWSVLHQNIVSGKWKGEQQRDGKGEQQRDGIQQLLSLIFMDLPVNLKNCLLYLTVFLENSEIDTDKLYMLWIAEGLVQSRYGESTDTLIGLADLYLQELASRGMVEVEKDEISKVKKFRSCRLNSMIRDMCLLIAKEENYLTVMDDKQSSSGSYKYFSTGKVRKIAAHVGGGEGRFSISFGQEKTDKIRSLLLLDTFPSENSIFQGGSLCLLKSKVLRVLHLDGLKFGDGKYPKQIDNLAFLKYLSFRNCHLENLPPSISKLLNLQTLDLRVREGCSLTIHNVLMKMSRMKHLYLPQSFRVHNDEKLRLDSLTELETLENFDSKLCCAQDLLKLINLRILTGSIHENEEDFKATVTCVSTTTNYLREVSLDIRSDYSLLYGTASQKLFLSNGLNTLRLDGFISGLPMIASSTLSVVVFTNSMFKEDPMPMLCKLPNLRVLVFDSWAFIGKQMLFPTLSFHELRHLKLSTLPYLKNLIVEEGTMPKLSSLTIEGCKNLKLHPNQLKSLKNLKETKISGTANAFEELQVRGESFQDGTRFNVLSKYSIY